MGPAYQDGHPCLSDQIRVTSGPHMKKSFDLLMGRVRESERKTKEVDKILEMKEKYISMSMVFCAD